MPAGSEVGTAWVSLAISGKGLVKDIKRELGGLPAHAGPIGEQAGQKFGAGMSRGMKVGLGFAVGGLALLAGGLIAGAKAGIGFNSSMEQTTIAMGVMLGSTEKATELIGQVAKMAAATPFEFPELADATKKLVAYGFAAKDTVPLMTRLGDVSSALNIPIGEMVDLYGKMRVSGRITMEDMNQLAGRGVPIYAALAEQMGVGQDKIRGLVEDGKVGFPQIEAAIASMTGTGGMFAGMMDKQSRSFAGLWSTIKDGVSSAFGKLMMPIFKWLVDTAMPKLAGWLDTLGKTFDEFGPGQGIWQLLQRIGSWVGDAVPAFKVLLAVLNPVGTVLVKVFQKAWPAIQAAMDTFFAWLEGPQAAGIFDAVMKGIGFAVDFVWSIVQTVWPAIQSIIKGVIDWLASPAGKGLIQEVFATIGTVLGVLKEVFQAVWPVIMSVVRGFITFLESPTGQIIIKTLLKAIGTVVEGVRDVFNVVWPIIKAAVQGFIDWLNSPNGQKVIATLIGAIGTVLEAVKIVWEAVWPKIQRALEIAKPYIEKTLGLIGDAIAAVAKVVQWLIDKWDALVGRTKKGYPEFPTQSHTIPQGPFPTTSHSIPKAKGGFVYGPTDILAGEAGTELILPLSNARRTNQLLGQAGIGGTTNNTYHITIDGSRMPSADFQGLIASIQAAQRMVSA